MESENGGEMSENSDAGSWEQVDETEAELTKWVPDHLASHCGVCQSKFWSLKRKHHCRYVPFSDLRILCSIQMNWAWLKTCQSSFILWFLRHSFPQPISYNFNRAEQANIVVSVLFLEDTHTGLQ